MQGRKLDSFCTSRRPDRRLRMCGSQPCAAVRPPLVAIASLRRAEVDYLDFIDTVQSIADGVLFGATYALLGIGFTLVFGVMHKINLSYAAASIGAAYASLLLLAVMKAPAAMVFLVSAAAGGRTRELSRTKGSRVDRACREALRGRAGLCSGRSGR